MARFDPNSSCGTCRHWAKGKGVDVSGSCEWPQPDVPFWATIDNGSDHADWTVASDGRRCPTFEGAA